jgi:hypothetical protein
MATPGAGHSVARIGAGDSCAAGCQHATASKEQRDNTVLQRKSAGA